MQGRSRGAGWQDGSTIEAGGERYELPFDTGSHFTAIAASPRVGQIVATLLCSTGPLLCKTHYFIKQLLPPRRGPSRTVRLSRASCTSCTGQQVLSVGSVAFHLSAKSCFGGFGLLAGLFGSAALLRRLCAGDVSASAAVALASLSAGDLAGDAPLRPRLGDPSTCAGCVCAVTVANGVARAARARVVLHGLASRHGSSRWPCVGVRLD